MCLFGTITKSLTDMRKCRNWQTSKTKDLVIIAIVWVQVPSPAFIIKEKGSSAWMVLFLLKAKRPLNPVQYTSAEADVASPPSLVSFRQVGI